MLFGSSFSVCLRFREGWEVEMIAYLVFQILRSFLSTSLLSGE